MSSCRVIVLSSCRAVELSSCRAVELSSCRAVELSSCRAAELSSCRAVELSSCRAVELSSCRAVELSSCRAVELSSCRAVELSSCRAVELSSCRAVELSSYRAIELSFVVTYFEPTDTRQLLYKDLFHPIHTFSGILKSQLLRFHRICNNKSDFEEAIQILFHSLRQRNYTPRFLRHIKNTTLADIKNRSRKEQAAKYQVKRCQSCTVFVYFTPINNTKVTQRDKINNFGTSNVVYLITCNACSVR